MKPENNQKNKVFLVRRNAKHFSRIKDFFDHENSKNFRWKVSDMLILIIGILLFFISYSFDQQVNLFFKGTRFAFLDAILSIVTNFGVVTVFMLIIPSIIFYRRNKKLVYLLLLTFAVSFAVAFIIKLIVLRQRPEEIFTYPLINIINYSFPSMHSMVVFSLLPIVIEYLPKQKSFWVTFTLLVIFSRIYFGFHFLSDVVFGALFGYFIGGFLLELYKKGKLWTK